MKPTETPEAQSPPVKPVRMQSAGLYGEVGVLPIDRAAPARPTEPRTFL